MRANPSLFTPLFSSLYCCAFFLAGGGGLYLVEHLEVKKDGGWRSLGVGSTRVGRGAGIHGGLINGTELGSDQVAVATSHRRGAMTVTLTSSSDQRIITLDKTFLRSGEQRVTHFRNADGCEYRISHWGERDCDRSEAVPAVRVVRDATVQRTAHAAAI
jgi:hypothetical protein